MLINVYFHINQCLEMNNLLITWRDKYTSCNIEPGSDADKRLFPYQPVPDYLRWLETRELHYLFQEKLKNLPVGSWTKLPSLLMLTDILNSVFDCVVLEKSLNRSTLAAVSFLVWLTRKRCSRLFKKRETRCRRRTEK